MARKICFVIGNRAHFSRIKPIIKHLPIQSYRLLLFEAAALSQDFDLQQEILDLFGPEVAVDTFHTNVSGSNLEAMTKSTGLSIIELSTYFKSQKPDVAVVVADRYEALAAAIAARYMNIPIAHIQGGENTGSIDDSVRHAITKLANLHFASNQDSAERITKMGEESETVFATGCPTLDIIPNLPKKTAQTIFQLPSPIQKYIVVTYHPVTTEYEQNLQHFQMLLKAVQRTELPAFWLMPNIDAGSDIVTAQIKQAQADKQYQRIHFFKHLPTEDYLSLIKGSACLVGNSSVVVRESALLGVPSVAVGNRQQGRLRGHNVVDSAMNTENIYEAIEQQVAHGPYEPDTSYGNGEAGARIAEILMDNNLAFQKQMTY